MLQFKEFDLKTGKLITDYNPDGERISRVKEVDNSYLERWLKTHKIEPVGLYVANFYDGVNDSDRQRREAEGKVLIVASGKSGYFTDPATANLIAKGDSKRSIQPIYTDSQRSAHNSVAYGSLVVSDGKNSAQTKQGSRILIIDDEHRSSGEIPIQDRDGRTVTAQELEKLYDKMGDGTMLVPTKLMRDLLLDQEVLLAIEYGLKGADVSSDEIGGLGAWIDDAFGADIDLALAGKLLAEYRANGKIINYLVPRETAKSIEQWIDRVARSAVVQFRAATPDLPGIAKGTAATSSWCERLGVDAIISSNDIKGDDGRLKTPGILKLESFFWLNRKITAEWSDQSVGTQVKGTIPEATLNEFNPIMAAKAAEIAVDPWQLASRYVEKEDRKRARELTVDTPVGIEIEDKSRNNKESLYKVLKADKYGQLSQLPNISRQLEQSMRRDRLDVATSGIIVPAAIAQHHSQLEPWEVCNRDLPHGAIVAYYRSPFPNVGAAAIAINNLDVLLDHDREAYNKRGVAYLNPWTAKNIAITDFDGDRNGFFVGYLAVDRDLPSQLREQLADSGNFADRYEAGRSALEQIINQPEMDAGTYPLAMREFIAQNAPELKPLPIAKAKKSDHLWQENEPLTAAIWRAWETTANNPTGKVANQSIILQSLAAETIYIDPAQKPALLKSIAKAYAKISTAETPTDEYLNSQGLPPMKLAAKIDKIISAANALDKTPPQQQVSFATESLKEVHRLIKDYCDSAVAKNLQTAVDTAKSSIGIDEDIDRFGEKLQYKQHQMRQNVKKPDIYLGRALPTNTQEPIGWAVETANKFYLESKNLPQLDLKDINRRSRSLLPRDYTARQSATVETYTQQYKSCTNEIQQVKERKFLELPEDRQPTLKIVSSSGKSLTIQRLCDVDKDGTSPVWDLADGSTTTIFQIVRNKDDGEEQYAAYILKEDGKRKIIGFVNPESAQVNELSKFDIQATSYLSIAKSTIEFHPPYAIQNDIDRVFARANQVLDEFERRVLPAQRLQYASAAWGTSAGMGIAIKLFPEEISAHLDLLPPITLSKLTATAQGLENGTEMAIRFDLDLTVSAISQDGSIQPLGKSNYSDAPLISPGTVVKAIVSRPLDDKIRITTDRGEFAVKPAANLAGRSIDPQSANFAFQLNNSETEVYFLKNATQRFLLGTLGRDLVNKEARNTLGLGRDTAYCRLSGSMSRGLRSNVMDLQVQELIAHQPVAQIQKGELLPLSAYELTISNDVNESLNIEPLEARAIISLVPSPSAHDRYNPTIGELRTSYSAKLVSGDKSGAASIEKLGQTLADLYPGAGRAPDDYRHPAVSIDLAEEAMLMSVAVTREQAIELDR
jgi:hypothetical protein